MERRGFLQIKILPIFGYYPWLCGVCRTSFLTRKRYRRRVSSLHEVENAGESISLTSGRDCG